jgi:hypothetical protein
VKKKTAVPVHAHSGGRKVVHGPRQKEALSGREENRKHKSNFKAGAVVKNDPNAGRPNGPLLTPHQNATPPARNKEEKS